MEQRNKHEISHSITSDDIELITTGMNQEMLRGVKETLVLPNNDALVDTMEQDEDGGPLRVQLNAVIVAGQTQIGLVTKFTQAIDGAPTMKELAAIKLPFGTNANGNSELLFKLNPHMLGLPRGDGVIQNWQRYSIGRNECGGTDSQMSREHFEVLVYDEGRSMTITDRNSTNGTGLIDLKAMDRASKSDPAQYERLLRLKGTLTSKPEQWNSKYTGMPIVYPH